MQARGDVGQLLDTIADLREKVARHPMYGRIRTLEDLRVFMGLHVFAVWDFMSLLKGLQRSVTCQTLPWRPVGDAQTRRLVNEIVMEEESDVVDGEATGHFELYLRAMDEIGGDTGVIRRLIALVAEDVPLEQALVGAGVPAAAASFVRATFSFIDIDRPHVTASAFTFGREDSIPSMFRNITGMVSQHGERTATLLTYLERHCQLDEEDHGPKAVEMVRRLCNGDPGRWAEATETAKRALEARIELWDAIASALPVRSAESVLELAAD